jgi:uncharacterized protein (DUF488 family)
MARARGSLRTRASRVITRLYTVGHGTLEAQAFLDLVRRSGIDAIVDVRRFPGSRRYPHFGRTSLEGSLPGEGIAYRWEERLGGRRPGSPDSPNVALRNAAFRAYADYMLTPPFHTALAELLEQAQRHTTAILCSESLWWRCHRRLIADAAQLVHQAKVEHLLHDGRLVVHVPTAGVRVAGDQLVYDAGVQRLLP